MEKRSQLIRAVIVIRHGKAHTVTMHPFSEILNVGVVLAYMTESCGIQEPGGTNLTKDKRQYTNYELC